MQVYFNISEMHCALDQSCNQFSSGHKLIMFKINSDLASCLLLKTIQTDPNETHKANLRRSLSQN